MDQIGKILLFRDVIVQGGFSHAARLRGLSHSTVSKQVKALEAELGATLLHRTSRTMSLTDEGRLALDCSRRMGAHIDELLERLEEMRGDVRGEIKVSALVHVGKHVVEPAVATYLREHPGARVSLTLDDEPLHFTRDGLDLAVRVGRHAEGSLIARKLLDNDVCLAAAPSFVKRHGLPKHPTDLAEWPTVAYASGAVDISVWTYVENGEFRTVNVSPVYRTNDGNALREAVCAGLGIGYLSTFSVRDEFASGRLTRVLPDLELPAYEPVYMIYAASEFVSPRLNAFVRCLEDAARSLSPGSTRV
ncbi:MAG: LysR family transcriptional regulator [Myxococcota bacterium]